MKYIIYFLKESKNFFYILASIFILILILNQFHAFNWIHSLFLAIKPIFIGIILSLFIEPFIHKIPYKRKINVIIIYCIILIIAVILFVILIPSSIEIFKEIFHLIIDLLHYWQTDINRILQSEQFINESNNIIQIFSSLSIDSTRMLFDFITTFLFSFSIGFLVSLEFDIICNEFKKYISSYKKIGRFYTHFSYLVFKYFKGLILDSLFLLIAISLFLMLLDIKYGLFFAFLICLLNLFPYIGALIGTAFCSLYVFLTSSDQFIVCVIGLFIIQQIESMIIHPVIFSKTMKVHPLHLLIALLIYEFLFGFIGIILSPLLAMIQQILFDSYRMILDNSQIGGWEEL